MHLAFFSVVHRYLNLMNLLCAASYVWTCSLLSYGQEKNEPSSFSHPCHHLLHLNLNSHLSDASYSLTYGGDASCAFSSLSSLLFAFSQLQPTREQDCVKEYVQNENALRMDTEIYKKQIPNQIQQTSQMLFGSVLYGLASPNLFAVTTRIPVWTCTGLVSGKSKWLSREGRSSREPRKEPA